MKRLEYNESIVKKANPYCFNNSNLGKTFAKVVTMNLYDVRMTLYKKYKKCTYVRQDDIDDIIQDSCIVTLQYCQKRNHSNWKDIELIRIWITISERRLSRFSELSNKHKALNIDDVCLATVFDDSSEYSEMQRRKELLYSCIDDMNEKDRQIAYLILDGKSNEEIGSIFGHRKDVVKNLKCRLKKKIIMQVRSQSQESN